jgi:hypothetical protein
METGTAVQGRSRWLLPGEERASFKSHLIIVPIGAGDGVDRVSIADIAAGADRADATAISQGEELQRIQLPVIFM